MVGHPFYAPLIAGTVTLAVPFPRCFGRKRIYNNTLLFLYSTEGLEA